ncbi:uncharacterized protein LOC142047569 [Chelonoidis abingdonii]|uniref:uncharacterized protein LOC142047569 n=1 Tax=Chelonoidis abingdonii TaxID=106734 RepID=UPI003F49A779
MSFSSQQCKQTCLPPPVCLPPKCQEPCPPPKCQEPCPPPQCQEPCPPPKCQEPCPPPQCQEPCPPPKCQEPCPPPQCQEPCRPPKCPSPKCPPMQKRRNVVMVVTGQGEVVPLCEEAVSEHKDSNLEDVGGIHHGTLTGIRESELKQVYLDHLKMSSDQQQCKQTCLPPPKCQEKCPPPCKEPCPPKCQEKCPPPCKEPCPPKCPPPQQSQDWKHC